MYFFEKYKNRIIIVTVTIMLLITMGFTSKERPAITKFEKIVGNVLTPINKVTFNIRKKSSDFITVIKNLSNILEENENLKVEIASLKEENREQEDIIGKFDYLKNEAELKKNSEYNLLSAQITSKEPGNWYDKFLIDKGLKDGVKKDDMIIQGIETENGVIREGMIGRVSDVGDNWAKVVSIIDELNSVSFKVLRTQDSGVISRGIDNTLEGYLFDSNAEVMVGDKLYTAGLGKIFKKDIYIGDIEEIIEADEELMKKIVVKPAVDLKKIYNVFVILD